MRDTGAVLPVLDRCSPCPPGGTGGQLSKAPRSGVASLPTTQEHQHPELLFEAGTPQSRSTPLTQDGQLCSHA